MLHCKSRILPCSGMGLVNYRLAIFGLIFRKIGCICEDLGFHTESESLQGLLVNFRIYLKKPEIKVLMTIVSKAIDSKVSLICGTSECCITECQKLIFVNATKNNSS